MPQFKVSYTFGAVMIVDADEEEAAVAKVEKMSTDDLIALACDGFEIQDVVEDGG